MKHKFKALAGLAVLAMTAAFPAKAETISMFCSATDYELCEEGAQKWAKSSGNEVKINRTPQNLDDAIPIYQQLFASNSPDVDLLYVDVIWLGMMKDHFEDISKLVPEAEVKAHFASAVEAARIDGKLLAMPFYIDTGLMFYRKDLLEKYGKQAPKTWDELTTTAKEIQDSERKAGNADMWGYSWQGRSYEGLTCDAIEWMASGGGGTILSDKGAVTVNNPQTLAALTRARGWIDTISPKGVLNYDEESSRALFESGNAVFHRNWPYVWGTSQADGGKLVGKVGVSALPVGAEGQKSSGTLGTAYLAVSKYSKKKEKAADLLRYMVGLEDQKMRAIKGGYNPTVEALYSDAEVLAKIPFLPMAKSAFEESVARPSAVTGKDYNRVSRSFYRSVHDIISGTGDIGAELAQLEKRLKRDVKAN
ncbi:ABC transporter substrate-binding protein [Phyllobacterium sp. P30BS-XVII]|uniref:ABC transporter substrate-binding protein n=1 Tax=Phyllobacterium sp. P30BS-XVII TaxID=2587046 RepID=UPI000DDC1B66|nr:ABC transporter substrate-binding protein [Phyllobacterium sp. P30BS-XVII]MBA8902917.1 trehalose/maltose transport system substrate-binding protein [Phyllobacterium sp. P30BS-XVII]